MNNRELATLIWCGLFFGYAFTKAPIRQSLLNVLYALVHPKILLVLGLMLGYVSAIVWAFHALGGWELRMLKDTVLWFGFGAMALVFEFVSNRNHRDLFQRILTDNLKVIVVLEFLVNAHTFGLLIELLILPILILILALNEMAQAKKEYEDVAKVTNGLQVMAGLLVLGSALWRSVSDFQALANVATLKDFLLAPVLSLCLSPFLYCVALVAIYEQIFVFLNLGPDDRQVRRYASRRLFWHIRFSLSRAQTVFTETGVKWMQVRTKPDVIAILQGLRRH